MIAPCATPGRCAARGNRSREALLRGADERVDAENVFDELKNQWGWNGCTTHKPAPCRLMANLIAPVYNWWNLYGQKGLLPVTEGGPVVFTFLDQGTRAARARMK
jgi:hypothetical protein